MNRHYDKNLKESLIDYIQKLKIDSTSYRFSPVLGSLTSEGKKIELGFSCLALKCYYMLGIWDEVEDKQKMEWVNYINSFQKNINNLPSNSYVDEAFVDYYTSMSTKYSLKNIAKQSINLINSGKYSTNNQKYEETIRADTKQAIATLHEVSASNKLKYLDFPKENHEVEKYLDSLNWNNPWTSGAQFSSLCVFSATQLNENHYKESSKYLYNYLEKVLNSENGLYYTGSQNNKNELINGAMKVITGLDWLELPIHYPEKLIDFCLRTKPNQEGCDIVDIIYVLYKCLEQSNYKRKSIKEYLQDIRPVIEAHYKKEEGGFSYFTNSSQQYYYGIRFSNMKNQADIHGTTLLVWALSMIDAITDQHSNRFNIIKP